MLLTVYKNITFSVAEVEASEGHVAVWVEDYGHDVPGGGELRRRDVPTKRPQEVSFVPRHAIVDLDVVVRTVAVELQLKEVKGE